MMQEINLQTTIVIEQVQIISNSETGKQGDYKKLEVMTHKTHIHGKGVRSRIIFLFLPCLVDVNKGVLDHVFLIGFKEFLTKSQERFLPWKKEKEANRLWK